MTLGKSFSVNFIFPSVKCDGNPYPVGMLGGLNEIVCTKST